MHSSSGRGVKLLFSKSKVYIHPTPTAKDNIPGFIALIQQKAAGPNIQERPTSSSSAKSFKAANFLLAWVPESSLGDVYGAYAKVDLSDASSPPRQTPLVPQPPTTTAHGSSVGAYAFAVPLSEIYSLLIRPPSVGWWYGSVVINTRSGDSFPALFFHDSECQSTILQKKRRLRDSFDPFAEDGGTFWGGDEVLRWLKRYVVVEKSGADPSVYLIEPSAEDRLGFGGKSGSPRSSTSDRSPGIRAAGQRGAVSQGSSRPAEAGMDSLTRTLKQARWSFLEKMSQVTTFTRKTAQEIVENQKIPPQVRRLMKNPEVQTLQDEFDSARVYLARWAMGIAEQSEKEKNQRIWTAQDVLELEESDVGEFEILDAGSISLGDKRKPVSIGEWNGFFHPHTGRLQKTPDEVKERIFHGGLNPTDGVRKEAWLFLFGVYDWNSTADERKAVINSKRDEFVRLKGAWWERLVDRTGNDVEHEWWKEQKGQIGILLSVPMSWVTAG